MIVSHAGRRQSDEAQWYPDATPNAEERTSVTNETLGLRIIKDQVPDNVFNIVAALAHGNEEFPSDADTLASLEYRLASYVDHRTTQQVHEYHDRMGDFLAGYFFARGTVSAEKRAEIKATLKDIFIRGKQGMEVDEADEAIATLGVPETSDRLSRRDFMGLVLQDAQTEALLEENGIDVANINDTTIPMPEWEAGLRKEYVEAARIGIIVQFKTTTADQQERDFPRDTWWGETAREIYNAWESSGTKHIDDLIQDPAAQ